MKDLVVQPFTRDELLDGIRADRAAHGAVVDAFQAAFYASRWTHNLTHWMHVPILKNPLDLWIYQELIYATRPTLIIETGTAYGGSALFFAHMLDRRRDAAHVFSVDIEPHPTLPSHPRLTFVRGSSTDPGVVSMLRARAQTARERVMVILDSDHSAAHVTRELEAYADLVTPGCHLVVEDTHYNDRPVHQDWMGGPGPGLALDAWLPQHPEFERDLTAERFMMTFYPGGWLRRAA